MSEIKTHVPCENCGELISNETLGDRSAVFCDACLRESDGEEDKDEGDEVEEDILCAQCSKIMDTGVDCVCVIPWSQVGHAIDPGAIEVCCSKKCAIDYLNAYHGS